MNDKPRLRYTDDKEALVKIARQKGLSDETIMKALVANEYGKRTPKDIIREWAPSLGLEPETAIEKAVKAGIVD
jgi:hypothetical protein